MIAELPQPMSDYLLTLIAPHGNRGINRSAIKTKLMTLPARVLEYHLAELVAIGAINETLERCDSGRGRSMVVYRAVAPTPTA